MFTHMTDKERKKIKVSVIIPALNEEEPLSELFNCLEKQSANNFEVIVADAGSDDKTRLVAEQYGAEVVEGGLPGVGRNRGAKHGSGEYLLFLDADVQIEENFIEQSIAEMEEKNIQIAGCEAIPMSDLPIDRIIHKTAYLLMKVTKDSNPRLPGYCMFFKKDVFETVGGFDEDVQLAEDYDLVRRATKIAHLDLLETVQVYVSMRRFDKEGRLPYLGKSVKVFFHRKFQGEIRDNSIEYEFDNFEEEQVANIEQTLKELEEQLYEIARRQKRIPRRVSKKIKGMGNTLSKLLHKN